VIEIEVQNETHQSQHKLRFSAVPRIGEGVRMREPDGRWASYDVLDVWYQKAEYGDVWVPYLHICMTPEEQGMPEPQDDVARDSPLAQHRHADRADALAQFGSLLPRQDIGR